MMALSRSRDVKDANVAEPSNAVIRSVEIHPSGQLLLTAGLDKRVRFFQVDGVRNDKIQSIYLEDLPIHKAAFARGGSQVVATGRRKHFYILDLEAAKVERVQSLVGCSAKIATSGRDGIMQTWDTRTFKCLHTHQDEGTLTGTALAWSPTSTHLATGSDSGVVNLYRQPSLFDNGGGGSMGGAVKRHRPSKAFMNLATQVDTLQFSPDGQMLAMSSCRAKAALRVAHVPSQTVFENWPTSNTPLGHVQSIAFSPNGGLLAIGNARGRALLYRLHYYKGL
ncbi:hypothetical protein WJX73_001142 [Symbiochloris irregularis]|uniref:Anaphase-promoting complex subunit 4 WD40 domain-containing protein n=1 Tax=Symbiochloris irregularis TaxID=706552 RepID=A0AAW1NRJ1_9CHLO